jgi:tol-pal system protein YbgF
MFMMNRTNSTTTARVFTMLAVVVTSSGCAMKGDIRRLQEELRTMAVKQDSLVSELRLRTQETQDTLRTQGDQMFDLRGDVNRQLQQINAALVRLEAIAGENQRGMTAIRDQLANMRRTGTGPGAMPDSTRAASPGGETLLSGTGSGNANQLYEAARGQLNRGSLNSASSAFQEFIQGYPTDPRVPDAHFYLADILSQQNRPQDALKAFQDIPQQFPTAERVPDSLYRIALLQDEMGDRAQAKATLERIMNTYPEAPVALLAREKLREIG